MLFGFVTQSSFVREEDCVTMLNVDKICSEAKRNHHLAIIEYY